MCVYVCMCMEGVKTREGMVREYIGQIISIGGEVLGRRLVVEARPTRACTKPRRRRDRGGGGDSQTNDGGQCVNMFTDDGGLRLCRRRRMRGEEEGE
jgi:hypothetical protein